jgi:hypothetical protein
MGMVVPALVVDETHLFGTLPLVRQMKAPPSGVKHAPPPGALIAVPGPTFA